MVVALVTFLLFSPKSLGHFYKMAKLAGWERVLGGDLFAFLPQVVRSLLRDGRFGGSGVLSIRIWV